MSGQIINWATPYGRWALDFSRPAVMAIINITPDSFSDGGRYHAPDAAVAGAREALAQGADILDLGAESSRPGAAPTPFDEEWARLEPVLKALKDIDKPISVDTYKAGTAKLALENGAAIINDIYAGRKEPEILEVAAHYKAPIILMHMLGEPGTMQQNPVYDNVVAEVHDFLLERAQAAQKAGIPKERIFLDPGLGFGKTATHNLALIKYFDKAVPQGYRRVMALSRKAFLGHILGGLSAAERDDATLAANAVAVINGAEIVRAHNPGKTLQAIMVAQAIKNAG